MTEIDSWFDDETQLVHELQITLADKARVPVIPGYGELRELARGGQGVVYSGVQLSTRRIVAVKVLLEGPADGVRGLRRFEREVDLAASLKHPNVVALHDSGTTPDGRPFLVMELVDGPTIDHAEVVQAARAHAFDRPHLHALLHTFAAVCDGVAHAHTRGVVHRDLKPGNIRVDGEGRPRVLDFGLAKALSPTADTLHLSVSGTGVRFVGSLPWASPEQALGRSDDIDVRSDVYALGVVLHQLLTDTFPYDIESDLRAALESIVNVAPASVRRTCPKLPVDVETIVLRCLQKERDRRYQSAADLARDVRRFIAGEPIDARRDSTWYVLRATARRHRVAVGASVIVLIALVGALVVSLWFWKESEVQREAAVAQAKRAERSTEYFADMLVSVDPDLVGPDAKMIDVAHRAAEDLKARFNDDPDTKLFFYTKLIELVRNLSDYEGAESLARDAITVAHDACGDDHPNTIFARANHALILHKLGRSDEALPILEAEAERLRRHPHLRTPATGHVFSNLGLCLLALDRLNDAERVFRELVEIEVPAEMRPDSEALALETLASIEGYRGNLDKAAALLRRALPIRVESGGKEHSATLRCLGNLAFYLAELSKLDEAEEIEREHVEISRRRMGPRHADTLSALNNHANYLERLGRLDEAEAELQECYESRVAVLGADHPHTLVTLSNLASLAIAREDYAKAEELLTEVVDLRTARWGAAHSETLIPRNNLASVLHARGRLTEAVIALQAIVTEADATFGEGHPIPAQFRSNLGFYLFESGENDEAEKVLRDSFDVLKVRLGEDNPATKGVRRRLVQLLRATDRDAEADALEPAAAPAKSSDG